MKRPSVRLSLEMRRIVLEAVVQGLMDQGIQVVVASMDDHHLHALARVRDHDPRRHMAIAKHYATKCAKAHRLAVGLGMKLGEGIWGKRSKAVPVRDRAHQLQIVRYILEHETRGAVTWFCAKTHRCAVGLRGGL